MPRSLLQQSSATAGQRLAVDIAGALAGAIDRAALAGSGQGQEPAGLLTTTGVRSVAFGTDGAEPSYAKLVEMEGAVGERPGGGWSYAWLTTSAGRAKLRSTKANDFSGASFWDFNLVLNRPGLATDALPSNLTKGAGTNLSPLIYGVWEDLTVALWCPAIELVVDGTTFIGRDLVRITAVLDAAIAVRRPSSFAIAADMVTAL